MVVILAAVASAACHAARPVVTPAPPAGTAISRLRQDVEAILSTPALERSYWGVLVKSPQRGDTIYALNPGRLLMPGSTLKIVTLAAASERLGWDHVFETRLVANGPIDGGVLSGDLIVVGSGDPSIAGGYTGEPSMFDRWADALKSRGVRTVTGRIIGDDNAFDDEGLGPGWTWDDVAGRDAVSVSALQFNENTVQATVGPGIAEGTPASVTLFPTGSSLYVDNQILTTAAGTAPFVTARRSPGSNRLELRGAVPIGLEPFVRAVSVDNPTLFFVANTRDALLARGIEVVGPAVDIDELAEQPRRDATTLVSVLRSPPLSTLAGRLMKNSQNLYAETLLKTLGSLAGAPTFEGGRLVAGETLAPWGVAATGLVQVDGSGLSRYNYLTAETLVTVLLQMEGDARHRIPFDASLAVAGRDGTLAARMRGTAAEANVHAKSGTLANVRSLAGNVTTADGERLVFAIIANNFGTMPEVAIAAIDAIVVKLAEFKR